jgi:hypothetical protein
VVERRRKGIEITIKFLMKKDFPSFRLNVEELGKTKELLTIMEGNMRRVSLQAYNPEFSDITVIASGAGELSQKAKIEKITFKYSLLS